MARRKRVDPPRRQRGARNDGTVGSLTRGIERMLRLDPGSVKIVRPDGKKKRNDATVASLRRDYKKP